MTLRTKLEIGAGVLAVVGALFAAWLAARDGKVRATANEKALQGALHEMDAAAQKRDADNQAQIAQLEAEKRNFKALPPVRQVQAIMKYIPLPVPIGLEPQSAVLSDELQEPLPLRIPAVDIAPLHDFVVDCQECRKNLDNANAALNDEKERGKALASERDQWKAAAKGGGFWTSLKRSAKWFGIGVLAGAAALCGTGHCSK